MTDDAARATTERGPGIAPAGAVCLRCGDFLERPPSPQAPAVAGIPLCAACVDGTVDERHTVFPRVSPWLRATRIWPVRALALVCGALILLTQGPPAPPRLAENVVVACLVVTFLVICAELLGQLLCFLPAPWNPGARWKREVATALGVPSDRARLAILGAPPARWFNFRMPHEVALVLEGEGGLVVLGERGTRLALPARSLRTISVLVTPYLPPRHGLILETVRGTYALAFLEGTGFGANRREAEALRDRLARRASA